ncbi:SsgA family sporulation/cell division regulator [Streptomyces sp. 5.8]|uniref:SsgA family sporulation/cell division regulator n=1 Tax=Streptomyces sp. 5.8 TaxID=3406571 RepID=UPI003BB5DD68
MGFPGLEKKIHMTLVGRHGTRVPVPVRLYYLSADPYAVQFSFDVLPDEVVLWTFARELLAQGMTAPAGIGDVKITPIGATQDPSFSIELESPDGFARLEGLVAPVTSWLDETYEAVPENGESDALDIDRILDELLAH